MNRHALGVLILAMGISSAGAQMTDMQASGDWKVRPYAEASVVFDDNVYRAGANEVDDVYFDPKVGLLFRSSADEAQVMVSGGLLYNRREYMDEDERSTDSYGAGLSLDYGVGEITEAQAVAGYRVIETEDTLGSVAPLRGVERGLIQDIDSSAIEREVMEGGAALKRGLTERTELLLGAMYTSVDYDAAASLDLSGWVAQGLVDYAVTDKLGVFGLARAGSQEQDGDNQTADSLTGQLGVQLALSDKLSLRAGAGVESYSRSLPGQADVDTDNASLSLSLDWQATDKLSLSAGGYNGTQLSSAFTDNAVEFINALVSATYMVSENINVSLRGVYRQDDYVEPVSRGGLSADREDDRIQIVGRVDYRPPIDNLNLFAQVSTEDVDSSIDAIDYSRTLIAAGLGLAY